MRPPLPLPPGLVPPPSAPPLTAPPPGGEGSLSGKASTPQSLVLERRKAIDSTGKNGAFAGRASSFRSLLHLTTTALPSHTNPLAE